jgi:hypothetical protein
MLPDRPLRARTRPGRLALFDRWLALSPRRRVLDVGFGETPVTTVELHEALGQAEVIGVERDEARVMLARTAHPSLRFECTDFAGLAALGPCDVVRAFNVLRGYRAEEVPAIHEALAAPLEPGGLVLEGSTDTEGHLGVAHVLTRTTEGLHREALLFTTDFSRGFAPWQFRDVLPRDFRRATHPGSVMHTLLEAWSTAAEAARTEGHRAPEETWRHSLLQSELPLVELLPGLVRWAPEGGVPLPGV